eukprot:Nitzschia sp. Nitz4//scaffold59_size112058//70731//72556//NITZ4_004114-RA/size112058-snap-gene-0.85-mRNA-1//-1//CDS//3329555138//4391//frame0
MVKCCDTQLLFESVDAKDVETVIVVGSRQGYDQHLAWVCNDLLKPILASTPSASEEDPPSKKQKVESSSPLVSEDFFQSILEELKPGDAGTSTETWLSRRETSNPTLMVKLVIALLPSSVSRHNAPAQPQVVQSLLRKHMRADRISVVAPLVTSPDHIYPTVCGLARVTGVPYSEKTGGPVPPTRTTSLAVAEHVKTKTLLDCSTLAVFPFAVPVQELETVAQQIQWARRLVDAPCNYLHTDQFLEEIKPMVADNKARVTSRIIRGQELKEQGYGGLYSVGQAAAHPPAMVILSLQPTDPEAQKNKSVVMVGKGIVYDTGGLSIKPKLGMPGMKRDMGGAAAILGAFTAAATQGLAEHRPIHAILCLAENAVSPQATRPDDVVTMYSGKTVEINNADAEGRLVLSDGVANAAKHLNPEIIVDMATLTGAQGVATGKYFAALYCNDDDLEDLTVQTGKETGDLCHPLPYAPEFFRAEFRSAVADMKNSVADRTNAQVSCAGQFIGNHLSDFLSDGGKWIHIDMAYPSFDKGSERATGWGVGLLYQMLKKLDKA